MTIDQIREELLKAVRSGAEWVIIYWDDASHSDAVLPVFLPRNPKSEIERLWPKGRPIIEVFNLSSSLDFQLAQPRAMTFEPLEDKPLEEMYASLKGVP